MTKMLVIHSRDLDKGSTKYRIRQYQERLQGAGVELEFTKKDAIDSLFIRRHEHTDIIFNQKCLLKRHIAKRLLNGAPKTIFDFDDAIYTRPGRPHSLITSWRVKRRFHQWLEGADIVTTANEYLAAYAKKYSSSVVVIPMGIDMEEWKPVDRPETELITIGWAGAPVNIPNIERLEPVLVHILDKYPNVRLAIFSGKKPELRCHYQHYPFRPGGEPEFMHSIDIGLLPLVDEEYSKGKSPIKAIQYAACGLPVVGNIFGATEEILHAENSIEVRNMDEWIVGLEKLIENPVLRNKMGASGRKYISQRHSIEVTSRKLIDIILGLTG